MISKNALVLSVMAFSVLFVANATAQSTINAGFNDLTGWGVGNDATLAHPGGIAPWSWDTPVNDPLILNLTETVLPVEGSGIGITYAGADSFKQTVNFPASGIYTISVEANAIVGASTVPLIDGQFVFLDGPSTSPTQTVFTADDWQTFSWTKNFSAGQHVVGIRNTLTAPYAIAYDQFTIVPEPLGATLIIVAAVTALACGRSFSPSQK